MDSAAIPGLRVLKLHTLELKTGDEPVIPYTESVEQLRQS